VSEIVTNKQIQPVPNRALADRARPRSLWGQGWMLLLQPGSFYRTLPAMQETRQWVWAAVIILALIGLSAVRQEALRTGSSTGGAPNFTPPVASGPESSGGFTVGPGRGGGPVGGDIPSPGGETPETPVDITQTWTTALIEASNMLLGWFILAVLLCEVSLFRGVRPRLGYNLQIAIWASLPLGLMALLQLIYYQAGGPVREPGLLGLLAEWKPYATLPHFWRSVAVSIAIRATVFWLWSLILIYFGARYALRGRAWASLLVVVMWAVVLVFVPVLTGVVAAPKPELPTLDTTPLSGPEATPDFSTGGQSESGIPRVPPAILTRAAGGIPGAATDEPDAFSPPDGTAPVESIGTPDATDDVPAIPVITPEPTQVGGTG
jgi:hypothetical protein